jgi:tetratricopeptide (TPR) repeat protein
VIDQDGGRLAERHANSPWSKALYADAMLVQGRKLEAVDAYKQAATSSSITKREIFSAVLLQMREALASQASSAIVPPAAIDELLAVVYPSSGALNPVCATSTSRTSSGRDASALMQKMECSYLDKDMLVAATAAARQLATNPDNPEALYWSVKANEKRAVEALVRYEQLAPQSPATYDMVGDLYRRRSQPDSALEQYSKVLDINPHDAPALMGSAASYLSIGDMEKTLTAAKAALVDAPKDARLNLIAAEAMVSLRSYADARPYLIQCLALVKDHDKNAGLTSLGPRAHALLGQVEADAGNISEAILEMNLGLSSDQDGSLYFQLSRLYRKEGKTVEAQQAIEHAKELIAQRRHRAEIALKSSAER